MAIKSLREILIALVIFSVYRVWCDHKIINKALAVLEVQTASSFVTADLSPSLSTHYDESYWKHTPLYAPSNETVIAMISPPGVLSGYRNQMQRFLALVVVALERDVKYILLNSLVSITVDFSAKNGRKLDFVPFSSIFDIGHWNTFQGKLPQIVDYHESSNYTCWKMGNDEETTQFINDRPQELSGSSKELIRQGNFPGLFNASKHLFAEDHSDLHIFKIKKASSAYTKMAHQCKGNPKPVGGESKALYLWGKASRYSREAEKNNGTWPFDAMPNFQRALRPNKKWRTVMKSCIGSESTKYIGIHLRVEPDMLENKCGKSMETNVTKIFNDIDNFLKKSSYHEENAMDAISIATSREALEMPIPYRSAWKDVIKENLNTLNKLTKSGTMQHSIGGKGMSIFECGKPHLDKYFANHPDEKKYDYGVLLHMVLNFEMLVESDIFIGVYGSSFSQDVWYSRYYRGKGSTNFEYTKEGIVHIGNEGMPRPFSCW
jgi:hypothetical protein